MNFVVLRDCGDAPGNLSYVANRLSLSLILISPINLRLPKYEYYVTGALFLRDRSIRTVARKVETKVQHLPGGDSMLQRSRGSLIITRIPETPTLKFCFLIGTYRYSNIISYISKT